MNSRQRLKTIEAHPSFEAALVVLKTLKPLGGQTVLAGGAVRDGLLGKSPKDLDFATSLTPDVVESAFEKALAIGKEFGTIQVCEGGQTFEVTTFRKEGAYNDGRHPSKVEFTEIEEDASRRDFTVNALYYDPLTYEVLDFVGGVADLRSGQLRTVGVAQERFEEDRLRMLRAIRFVSQLGFSLDEEALQAIQSLAPKLQAVSTERVLAEVKRLTMGAFYPEAISILNRSKLAPYFWPDAQGVQSDQLKVFMPFLSWENAVAAVFVLNSSDQALAQLKRWKASRDSQRRVETSLKDLRILLNPFSSRAQRAFILGSENFADTLNLSRGVLTMLNKTEQIESWLNEFLEIAGPDGGLPQALLNGQDLIQQGFSPGQEMGEVLKSVYEAQLNGEIRTKAEALVRISEFKSKLKG